MAHDLPTTSYKINRKKIDSEFLRNKLKLKSLEAKGNLIKKYPHVEKFLADKGIDFDKLRQHSAKVITTGALTGSLLFSAPNISENLPLVSTFVKNLNDFESGNSSTSKQEELLSQFRKILPEKVGPLTRIQEKNLEQIVYQVTNVPARATLEGEHLNTTYGYIGAEQHLARYPGDTIYSHPKTPKHDEGMAPGKGAWGYFAKSKPLLNSTDTDRERWYAVVQTLYLPDWEKRLSYVRDWYKYRKVLIINTVNGNAVIADIADSGPAAWTGKHFGGSPEVMNYLGGANYKKGEVIVFFVDDSKNEIPLGPVEYNKVESMGVTLTNV